MWFRLIYHSDGFYHESQGLNLFQPLFPQHIKFIFSSSGCLMTSSLHRSFRTFMPVWIVFLWGVGCTHDQIDEPVPLEDMRDTADSPPDQLASQEDSGGSGDAENSTEDLVHAPVWRIRPLPDDALGVGQTVMLQFEERISQDTAWEPLLTPGTGLVLGDQSVFQSGFARPRATSRSTY